MLTAQRHRNLAQQHHLVGKLRDTRKHRFGRSMGIDRQMSIDPLFARITLAIPGFELPRGLENRLGALTGATAVGDTLLVGHRNNMK